MKIQSFLPLLAIVLLPSSLCADDWPHFHGPARTSASSETGLNFDWPAGGPAVLWSAPLGPGYGGAAVVGDEVFLIDREAEETDILRCLDKTSGKELWRFSHPIAGRLSHPGSRGVPTVEKDAVYIIGGFGHVHRVNRKTHQADWTVAMQETYDTLPPKWGYAQSALVVGDIVVIAPMSDTTGLAGLDKRTGKEIWRTEPFGDSHSSPVLITLQGNPQVIFLAQKDKEVGTTISVEPASGKVLWKTDEYLNSIPITPPFKIDEERLFLTGGYGCGSAMVRVRRDGGDWNVKKLFAIEKGTQIHPPILHGDHLYFLANENDNYRGEARKEGGMMCMTLEGEEVWRTGDDPYMGRGNLLYADGKILIQDGHIGYLRVMEPSTDGFRVIAEADIFGTKSEAEAAAQAAARAAKSGSKKRVRETDYEMWCPMALSNGLLFMRSHNELKCVDLRG